MHERKFSRQIGMFLSFFGLVLLFFGIYRGEMTVIFTKAIHICLECIGIG